MKRPVPKDFGMTANEKGEGHENGTTVHDDGVSACWL